MIKEEPIIVPGDIRYISEWREKYGYTLPDYPCIINKQITGCGFTEECIRNNECVVLCSPRKMLLDNKFQQHPNEVYYAKNSFEATIDVDKDLTTVRKSGKSKIGVTIDPVKAKESHIAMIDGIRNYVSHCIISGKPAKILVTYDSFRIVKEALLSMGTNIFGRFRVVIDEFQSIFTDSKFKSETELDFLYHLGDIQRLNFVSATPMIDTYLDEMEEFENIPYIEYDWVTESPDRLIQPELKVRSMSDRSVMTVSHSIIKDYLVNNFEHVITRDEFGDLVKVESKELIIYVNSVKNITDIIRKSNITPDQINILCSNTVDNQKKIDNSLRGLGYGKYLIGSVPLPSEPRKMFTICTRTVYLGADFYSDNARTLIISDANVDCLAVDITLDLPQILGRQRLECNPWKNRAEMFVKTLTNENIVNQEEFMEMILRKKKETNNLISIYDNLPEFDIEKRRSLMEKYLRDSSNYKYDYVAVSKHASGAPILVPNKLVMLAEKRAFEIQQLEYASWVKMFNTLHDRGFKTDQVISVFLSGFYDLKKFPERMRYLCDNLSGISDLDMETIFKQIPAEFSKYYYTLGPEKIKACGGYERNKIDKAYQKSVFDLNQMILDIYIVFSEGEKLSNQEIADRLEPIYEKHRNPNKPKAVDISNYFETKIAKVTLPDKTRLNGLKLIKRIR